MVVSALAPAYKANEGQRTRPPAAGHPAPGRLSGVLPVHLVGKLDSSRPSASMSA